MSADAGRWIETVTPYGWSFIRADGRGMIVKTEVGLGYVLLGQEDQSFPSLPDAQDAANDLHPPDAEELPYFLGVSSYAPDADWCPWVPLSYEVERMLAANYSYSPPSLRDRSPGDVIHMQAVDFLVLLRCEVSTRDELFLTVAQLAPDWTGPPDELLAVARSLVPQPTA